MRWLEKMRISQIFRPVTTVRTCWSCQNLVQRSIYTDKQLSVQKYVAERDKLKMVMQSTFVDDKKKRLQKYFVPSAGQLAPQPWLLANDFVQFLHVIDDTEADFQLLEQLMDVFKRIDMTNLRNVNVGLILMKMLHHFKRDKSAMKFYNDPVVRQKFLLGKQTNLVYFDLLYKQKKYKDLLNQFDILKEYLNVKQLTITRSIYVLVFATCYKQNSKESFEYARQLHNQYSAEHITQDHLVFLSALANEQSAPHVANELIQMLWPTSHRAIPSIRLDALMQMRKFIDSLQLLRSILVVFDNNRSPKEQVIALEVITEAEQTFKQFCDDQSLQNEFTHLKSNLSAHGYIVDTELQTMVFEPFHAAQMTRVQKQRMFLHSAFDNNMNMNNDLNNC